MTRTEVLAAVLADGAWHSTQELVQKVGHRFSAALHVAVTRGDYRVEKRRLENGQFEYRLVN